MANDQMTTTVFALGKNQSVSSDREKLSTTQIVVQLRKDRTHSNMSKNIKYNQTIENLRKRKDIGTREDLSHLYLWEEDNGYSDLYSPSTYKPFC